MMKQIFQSNQSIQNNQLPKGEIINVDVTSLLQVFMVLMDVPTVVSFDETISNSKVPLIIEHFDCFNEHFSFFYSN